MPELGTIVHPDGIYELDLTDIISEDYKLSKSEYKFLKKLIEDYESKNSLLANVLDEYEIKR